MEIFKLFGTILVDSSKAEKSISKTGKQADGLTTKLGKGIKTAATWAAGLTAGAVAVGGAMLGMASKAAEATDRIDKMSQKMGFSREGFQEWEYVLSQSGASIEGLKGGMKTLTNMTDDLANGSKTATQSFGELGLSYDDLAGKTQEEIFETTVTALQGVEDETKRAALANDLLGKAGAELAPLLNTSSEAINGMKDKANELGMVLSDDAVDAGVKFTDSLDTLKRSAEGLWTQFSADLMPIFTKLFDWITEHMPQIKETAETVFDAIGDAVSFVWDVFKENLLPILEDLWAWIEPNLPTIKETFKTVFETIFNLVDQVWSIFTDNLLPILKDLWDFISPTFPKIQGVVELAFEGVVIAVQTVIDIFDGVTSAIKTAVEWLTTWNDKPKENMGSFRNEWNDLNADGYNASGLPFVPYDGYRAVLHRGETVLNADNTQGMISTIVNALSGAQSGNRGVNGDLHLTVNMDGNRVADNLVIPLKDALRRRGESFP